MQTLPHKDQLLISDHSYALCVCIEPEYNPTARDIVRGKHYETPSTSLGEFLFLDVGSRGQSVTRPHTLPYKGWIQSFEAANKQRMRKWRRQKAK